MKSASEYWKERFGEEPKSDNDKLMCAMMREYAEHYQEEMHQALSLGAVVGQSEQLKAFIVDYISEFELEGATGWERYNEAKKLIKNL